MSGLDFVRSLEPKFPTVQESVDQLLQQWQKRPTAPVVFYLFDVLWSDGRDLTGKKWVRPKLMCEVAFAEWTKEGELRRTTFLGWRDDKSAEEVLFDTVKIS